MFRSLRQYPDHFRTLSSLSTHLGLFKHFIGLNFYYYYYYYCMHSIIIFILFTHFHFYSLFVYYYHCHYYYYYYFLFFIFILFIHFSNRKLLELFRLQNVHIAPLLNDGIVQLGISFSLSFSFNHISFFYQFHDCR